MNYNHIPSDVMTKYLTDDLSPEERRTAELHIAVCPECAAKLDEQRRFEDTAARSYPRTFSGKLDPDCAKAIDEAVRDRLNTPEESPFWTKRIRGAVVIQFLTVAAVALVLFAMIVAPSDSGKKEKDSVPDKKETALTPDRIPVSAKPAAGKPSVVPAQTVPAKKADAVNPAKTQPAAAETVRKTPQPKESLNPGLVRLLNLNELSLLPPEKEPFRLGVVCMESPFEPGVRILLAVSAPKADPAAKRGGFRILPEGKTVLCTLWSKPGEADAVSASLLCGKTEDPASVFVTVVVPDDSAAVAVKDVRSKADAPAPLRLAAVMHAAGKPRILLKREIREKMIEELRSLAKNEYAGSPQVARFLEKLEKVK